MNRRDHDIKYWDAMLQSDGSYIYPNGQIRWFNAAGQNHREDGPAVIYTDGSMLWTLYDVSYSLKEWCIELNKSDEEKMLLLLRYK